MSGAMANGDQNRLAESRRRQVVAAIERSQGMAITELADLFSVSPATIRRDINLLHLEGRIQRVHGGAVPAVTASSHRNVGAAFTLGMVAPSLGSYWAEIAFSAQAHAVELGQQFVLRSCSDPNNDYLATTRAMVAEHRLDGLLLAPPPVPSMGPAVRDWVHEVSPRTVFVERGVDHRLTHVSSVRSDQGQGAALAVQHLSGLGHRRVALLMPLRMPHRDEIAAAWRQVVDDLGLADVAAPESFHAWEREGGTSAAEPVVTALRDEGVTAVLMASDSQAWAMLQAAQRMGIRVPHDLSVVGYDDDVAANAAPPLTSVRQPRDVVGRMAVRLLVETLRRGEAQPVQHIRLNCRLVIRQSTGPGPGAPRQVG
ncbi:substrate-binding domain-containing protein [Microlunatus sp. Y2014]|uniref:LacI family DNA-binding transcriptional regulator n=1 Tax=Microlunatus sp. Y2014 TaxID=3418488 RepID=UPI003DA70636